MHKRTGKNTLFVKIINACLYSNFNIVKKVSFAQALEYCAI